MWWLIGFLILAWIGFKTAPKREYRSRKEWYSKEYLHSKHWRKTRNRALAKANFMCKQCGATQRLQVHHLTYAHLGQELDSDLIVLCKNCHRNLHKKSH